MYTLVALYTSYSRALVAFHSKMMKMVVHASTTKSIDTSVQTLSEQVQVCCAIAKEKLEVGDYEAGCAVLEPWWQLGEWWWWRHSLGKPGCRLGQPRSFLGKPQRWRRLLGESTRMVSSCSSCQNSENPRTKETEWLRPASAILRSVGMKCLSTSLSDSHESEAM